MLDKIRELFTKELDERILRELLRFSESAGCEDLNELIEQVAEVIDKPLPGLLKTAERMFKAFYGTSSDQEGELVDYLLSCFALWSLCKAVERGHIFSKFVGYLPDMDVFLRAALHLIETNREFALSLLERLKRGMFGFVFTADLLAEPAFLALLFLAELCHGTVERAVELLRIYMESESEFTRMSRLISKIGRDLVSKLKTSGRSIDILKAVDALISALPDEIALALIHELLSEPPEQSKIGLLESVYVALIKVKASKIDEASPILSDISRWPEVPSSERLVPPSYAELSKARLLSKLVGILSGKEWETIGDVDEASWLLSKLYRFSKVLLKTGSFRSLAEVVRHAMSICLRFWEHLEPFDIILAHELAMIVSGIYDAEYPLKSLDFFLRALVFEKAFGQREKYVLGIHLLVKSVNVTKSRELVMRLVNELEGFEDKIFMALKKVAEAKLKFLSTDFQAGMKLLEEAEKLAEELDKDLFCIFMIEIAHAFLRINALEEALRIVEGTKCEGVQPESLAKDAEINLRILASEILTRLGRYDEAERLLDEVEAILTSLQFDFLSMDAASNLLALRAKIHAMRGDYDRAAGEIEQAMEIRRKLRLEKPDLYVLLAHIMIERGQKEEAIKLLKRVASGEFGRGAEAEALSKLLALGRSEHLDEALSLAISKILSGELMEAMPIVAGILVGLTTNPEKFSSACKILEYLDEYDILRWPETPEREALLNLFKRARKICGASHSS